MMYNGSIVAMQANHHNQAAEMAVIISHEEIENAAPSIVLFGAATVASFTALVIFLTAINFYPEPEAVVAEEASVTEVTEVASVSEVEPTIELNQAPAAVASPETHPASVNAPVMVIIDALSIAVTVANPVSTDIAILDNALLNGAVKYPGSANVGEDDNMVIFGHSSYLPVVRNQAFKAFNGLQHLEEGNLIRVRSATVEEVYRVSNVRLAQATESEVISLATGEKMLTLVTCNTFGEKADRWVVTAEFVGTYPIAH